MRPLVCLGALALMGAGPAPLPLDHLLNDAVAARAFDYGALRDSLGPDGLKALDAEVRETIATRVAKAPSGCETQAEAFVRGGLASADAATDAATWRTDWAAAMTLIDQLDARTALALAGGDTGLPNYEGVRDDVRAAKATTDPRLRELFTRVAADQASRRTWRDIRAIPQTARRQMVSAPLGAWGCRIDSDNTAWLKAEWRRSGWFTAARDGQKASQAAWLIVQHADRDPQFQRAVLPTLAKDTDLQSRINYAYLTDRVAVNAKEPQTYGTQGRCVGPGAWEPDEVRDPEGLEARRATLQLGTEAEYQAQFKTTCANFRPAEKAS